MQFTVVTEQAEDLRVVQLQRDMVDSGEWSTASALKLLREHTGVSFIKKTERALCRC